MELLPDEDERLLLLDHLARLILAAGAETFIGAPYVEPSDRWFPDRWTPDAAGVERLIGRMLGYAGLEHLDLTVEIDRFATEVGKVGLDGHALGHEGTAAWFAGIRAGVCAFGVDVRQLRDPGGLVGTIAHEVGHAYRHAHDLCDPNRALEERLTDLTTVYLGFGVLTVAAAQRYRSGIDGAGRSFHSHAHGGYLSPQSMSYLLAAQVVARGDAPAPVARHLPPNQKASFKAACAELGDRETLIARLGLPLPALWPPRDPAPRRSWFRRLFGGD